MCNRRILKDYLADGVVLNFLLLVSMVVIVSFQVSKNWPVLFGLDAETVNYYYSVFVDLSLGYVVSLIFYVLVVYCPEKRRKLLVRAKTSIVFARLQTVLKAYIFSTLDAFDINFKSTDDIEKSFVEKAQKRDLVNVLKNKQNEVYLGMGDTVFDLIVQASIKIINLRQSLIPFLMFMEDDELDFYSDLEDILVFENVPMFGRGLAVDGLFWNEFKYVVDAYNKVQRIVGGTRVPVEYQRVLE